MLHFSRGLELIQPILMQAHIVIAIDFIIQTDEGYSKTRSAH